MVYIWNDSVDQDELKFLGFCKELRRLTFESTRKYVYRLNKCVNEFE